MPFYPDFTTSNYALELPQPDGRILAYYSGVAVFNFRGTGGSVRRDDL